MRSIRAGEEKVESRSLHASEKNRFEGQLADLNQPRSSDDDTIINAAGLWPLLEPNWRSSSNPKKRWKSLAIEKDYRGKHFDWFKLAARYFPTRVDEKGQQDPSLAVAHNCFWRFHPARAYEWELRLQDEIHPNFTIDEPDSDHHRQTFLTEHRDKAKEIRRDEYNRRKRNADGEEDIQPVVAIEDHPTSADEVPKADDTTGEKVVALEEKREEKERSFHDNVHRFRRKQNMTVDELAECCKMTADQLHDLQREEVTPNQLYELAEALDVTVKALETGEREVDEDFDEKEQPAMAARSWDDD